MLPLSTATCYPIASRQPAIVVKTLCLLGCDLNEMVAFDSGMAENIDGPEAQDGVISCTDGCSWPIEDAR